MPVEFGHDTTADEVLEGVDLEGKCALVTGGASGIGRETARALAAKGAHVVIAVRDLEAGEAAAKTIRESTGNERIDVVQCDLASLESIRRCAETLTSEYQALDLLINNAGVAACPYQTTADGFEMQFGTNHLGHFLLTNLLMPLLENAEHARIVNVSSLGHHFSAVHLDDPHFERRDYDKWAGYGQSKTANILFTVALEKRLAGKNIHVYAVHPGEIATNLGRHLTRDDFALLKKRVEENPKLAAAGKSIEAGSATTCYAATAPELDGRGGVYCEDCHIADIEDVSVTHGVRSYALDSESAERLWALSEESVGEQFGY